MSGLNEKSRDPSMEDVLASIRKIIAEEFDAAHHAVVEDIGPSDHNLPWAEQQTNGQARKTPPVLPAHSALVFEDADTNPAHSATDDAPASEKVEFETEAQGHAIMVSDSVVSDEQRAAVAEFEQAVSALPVQDSMYEPDEADEITHSETAPSTVSPQDDNSIIADDVDGQDSASAQIQEQGVHLTDWQSAPLPFEISSFSPSQTELDVKNEVVSENMHFVPHKEQSSHYADFLEAQKPQLNVKLDLSFLEHKFHDQNSVNEQKPVRSLLKPEVAPFVLQSDHQSPSHLHETVSAMSADPVRAAPDFLVFAGDDRPATLPPFIPANEPSYAPLVSQRTTEALLSSLRQLTEATRPKPPPSPEREQTLSPRLDEFMADILRPLLSEWLDANLERIVDQAVREEIAKVTRSFRP